MQQPPSYTLYPPAQAQPAILQQAQPVVQQQAPPVAPVPLPGSPFGGMAAPQPQPQQQAQPSPAQLFARRLMELARTLEQLIPGYQIAQSALLELTGPSGSPPAPGFEEAARTLQELLYWHGAALGTIRRLLIGDANPALLSQLTGTIQGLQRLQSQARPLLERLPVALPGLQPGAAAALAQSGLMAEALLSQAAAAAQSLAAGQGWEPGRRTV